MAEPIDIGLYVHVPFCTSKCGYCDFYSHVGKPGAFAPLVDALLTELDAALQREVRVETIFVGGGTPTVLPVELLAKLLDRLGEIARRDGCVEFTVEANPATVDAAKADVLMAAGVNRVSMGAQSFNVRELAALDREHKPADVAASLEILRRSGLTRFNLDLIFGVPGQSLNSWLESLTTAVALGPEHLSCYGLTYEPGTPLQKRLQLGRISAVGDELESQMYLATRETLAAAGYRQYEISNYARPGLECRHNLRYWHNLPGIGIGPSAASYWQGRRWRNLPDTAEYVRRLNAGQSPAIDVEELSPRDRAGETAMLALRTIEGIDPDRFRRTTGFDPLELFADAIRSHVQAGLLVAEPHRIALTQHGLLLADMVMADFLSP
ncbi:MAG TPA: radical SAM family heme chaperone HemW [Phycisphaerae bacterium]|nr:radical SAM family heme chaperone HemW [Phycisphaerae bacterium]HOJ76163.1 radical SAM family heme chaperone HemW [Phycisphaerae bacterium]HOM53446.1 radical SAM family heme chaperone HemW [Phycisphaerae bacterium]HON66535.1 radical SAM family heme chaperone HemW [Phycisphaerae bacterium]HOQ84539.1 radical SAM family heme chaperone HemW [Phycisphaerae bacterium]